MAVEKAGYEADLCAHKVDLGFLWNCASLVTHQVSSIRIFFGVSPFPSFVREQTFSVGSLQSFINANTDVLLSLFIALRSGFLGKIVFMLWTVNRLLAFHGVRDCANSNAILKC